MISFVPGVYSGLTAEPENEKRGGSCSYPSDFMDDHGPLTCVSTTTLSVKHSMLLRLIRATYQTIVHFSYKYNIYRIIFVTRFLNNISYPFQPVDNFNFSI